MTIWPSWNATDIRRPAIWLLTVTVASGVTAPSALIVIGISPMTAAAARTVCSPPVRAPFVASEGVGWTQKSL